MHRQIIILTLVFASMTNATWASNEMCKAFCASDEKSCAKGDVKLSAAAYAVAIAGALATKSRGNIGTPSDAARLAQCKEDKKSCDTQCALEDSPTIESAPSK